MSRGSVSETFASMILASACSLAMTPATTPTPSSTVSCPDQAAALLPKIEPPIEEFKDERDAAFATWMRDATAKSK